jgi:hypothetical protein
MRDKGKTFLLCFMQYRKFSLIVFCFLAILPSAACPVALGLSAANNSQPFSLSLEKPSVQIYGRGTVRPRCYFSEFLPGNFTRTLRLDKDLPPEATIHWLFTGPRGSLSIEFGRHSLTVVQQYYDSYALDSSDSPGARYPHANQQQSSVVSEQSVKSVTLAFDHLTARISVNGHLLIKQLCLIDLMRHQLYVIAPDSSTGIIQGSMSQPETESASVSIDSTRTYQTMLGFGGITSIPAYREMTDTGRAKWWKLLQEYNLLIQREYPIGTKLNPSMDNFDRLQDASPHYYGDNFPNGEISDFAYLKQLRSIGGQVFFEFWVLPEWARDPETGNANVDKFVAAVLAYCRQSVAKTGSPPDVVGIQNEVIQPGPVWGQMILKPRKALDDAGFQSVKLHMSDAGTLQVGVNSAKTVRQINDAWKALGYSATHVYDYQSHITEPDSYLPLMRQWVEITGDKPFLATELAMNDSQFQADSFQTALAMGELYDRLLTVMNAKSLAYCWLLLDPEQPSFGFTRSLFTVDRAHSLEPQASGYQLRVFGAFSRHIRQGMVRIEAGSSDPDLLASAFRADSGAMTLVFLNRSTKLKQVSLTGLEHETIQTIEHASLYRENSIDPASHNVLVIDPGEIVTMTTVPSSH